MTTESFLVEPILEDYEAADRISSKHELHDARVRTEYAIRIVEKILGQGMEAGELIRRFGPLKPRIEGWRSLPFLTVSPDNVPADVVAAQKALARLCSLILDALNRAEVPPPPLDMERINAVRAAHARGETKPFRRSTAPAEG